MATSKLDGLPPEMIQNILTFTTMADRLNMRLVNRYLDRTATERCFTDMFQDKKIDITEKSLHFLVAATKPGRPGCSLQHLFLCGWASEHEDLQRIVNNGTVIKQQLSGAIAMSLEYKLTPHEMSMANSDLRSLKELHASYIHLIDSRKGEQLLLQVFENIKANSRHQRLQNLSVVCVCFDVESRKSLSLTDFGTGICFAPRNDSRADSLLVRLRSSSDIVVGFKAFMEWASGAVAPKTKADHFERKISRRRYI